MEPFHRIPIPRSSRFWTRSDPSKVNRQNSASHLLIVSVLLTLRAVLDFAASMAKNLQVENMDEADFMTLGRWLMGNTKDMEVRGTPGRLGTHPPADQRAFFFVPGS